MFVTSRRELHGIRRPRAAKQQLAAVRLAEPAPPAVAFVPPHRCGHCSGKRRVAPLVWERFGNVDTYNEPFAGGLSVLLGRPHEPRIETANDIDCHVANFWRALQHDPDGVARFCDWPVNEADLHARHRWLVDTAPARAERLMTDPDFYDVKVAGYWVYGQCLWIGSGWCEARRVNAKGVHRGELLRKRPAINGNGSAGGVHRELLHRPQRSAATRSGENPSRQRKRFREDGGAIGVHRRWQGGGAGGGSGVHAPRLTRQLPQLSGDGSGASRGLLGEGGRSVGLYEYLSALAARLRRVRVCCGDWTRVLTPSVTTYIGITGVFLDPPYRQDLRERCYAEDHDISAAVRAWALAHGDHPKMRIALCGYEDEHKDHMPPTWACVPWKAHGGYSRTARGKANRDRERIWFSPHCLQPMLPVFAGLEEDRTCSTP